MRFIYNILVHIAAFFLKIIAFFNPKIKRFVHGRKAVFSYLENKIPRNAQIIWVHAASLGEFEQGLPVIEKIKLAHPSYNILVTFFSPSGFEVKKDTPVADWVTYLPLDTKQNANRFLRRVNPKLAIFIKYELWPNYLEILKKRGTPTLLISALFKKDQVFFKWYGHFMRKSLESFSHFFVQDANSRKLLKNIHIENVSVTGDTRFDRVAAIQERDNSLDFMEGFKLNQLCLVAGSTWPEDEAVLLEYINGSHKKIKYVLAPHTIKQDKIQQLKSALNKKTILYSEIGDGDLSSYEVLIVDTIGLLTKIYSYANIAYVGGGFATGLHNTLEPAVFGVPIIIGPNYKKFKEAEELVAQKGMIPIHNALDLKKTLNQFIEDENLLKKAGKTNAAFVMQNKGASSAIATYIHNLL